MKLSQDLIFLLHLFIFFFVNQKHFALQNVDIFQLLQLKKLFPTVANLWSNFENKPERKIYKHIFESERYLNHTS